MAPPAVVIDCDPGHDDFLAILLAQRFAPGLRGITTVAGNTSVASTTRNACIAPRLVPGATDLLLTGRPAARFCWSTPARHLRNVPIGDPAQTSSRTLNMAVQVLSPQSWGSRAGSRYRATLSSLERPVSVGDRVRR